MMTPSEVNSLLWQRGLPDVGEWLQRRLQHVDYLEDRVDELKRQVLELEKLLPDHVKDDRTRQQEEIAAASRASYGAGRRAPPESDG
jgi:ribosomal protein S18